jgi:glycosyltransferase involved in cell wall biosynthesis
MVFKASAEHATPLPALFDQLSVQGRQSLTSQASVATENERFVQSMHKLRAALFELFLDGLSGHLATVNLPSFVKAYAGRVIESMAIGQPVVSWRIPHRPQIARLFRDAREIELFDGDDPDQLAARLHRLRHEPHRAARLGHDALENASVHHTSEHRVAQILDWTRRGILPRYWD